MKLDSVASGRRTSVACRRMSILAQVGQGVVYNGHLSVAGTQRLTAVVVKSAIRPTVSQSGTSLHATDRTGRYCIRTYTVYIYIHNIYIYIYIYTHTHIYIYICTHTYIYIYRYMLIYIYLSITCVYLLTLPPWRCAYELESCPS